MVVSTIRTRIGCGIIFFLLLPLAYGADTNSFAARAEQAFEKMRPSAGKDSTNVSALLSFTRAAFDWAEFARNEDHREEIAQRGIEASRRAVELSPTNATAHYWLGMNLGQLARTKSLGALKLVREMESEFLRARDLDPHVDYAGPDRSLGYLYRDAPGWPTSIGSKRKAREHFERAVQLHPEFPENQLSLLESFEQWADRQNFARQLKTTEKVMADSEKKFRGPDWEFSHADWNKRWSRLKSKAADVGKTIKTGK
jgi:tetratricopeptide (TPR) repeat protein